MWYVCGVEIFIYCVPPPLSTHNHPPPPQPAHAEQYGDAGAIKAIDAVCRVVSVLDNPKIKAGLLEEAHSYVTDVMNDRTCLAKLDTVRYHCPTDDDLVEFPEWRVRPFHRMAVQALAIIQPSSASVERVFSLLKRKFGCTQTTTLADAIEVSLQLDFNGRTV